MTATKGSDDRVILPRWRAWRGSQSSGELESLDRLESGASGPFMDSTKEAELSERLTDFRQWRGPYEAADVVSTAIVLGLEEFPGVRDAAKMLRDSTLIMGGELAERILLKNPSKSKDTMQELESRMTLNASQSRSEDASRIACLRDIVRREPRNSLRWADLALAHTVIGNKRSAAKAIIIAVSLANGNRFVLRSAARFHVHEGDLDAAHAVLTADVDRLVSDPWLMAAEIAIADMAGRPLRYVSRGRGLLTGDFAPRHVSELASALATVELRAGRVKRARRLFEKALEDPTENSLAQVEWSVERGVNVQPRSQSQPPGNFEAEARHAVREGEFLDATTQSRLWQEDQPFALDPALHTSYVASTLAENYEVAITACRKGLIANPGDSVLLNNLAFSQANAGLVDDASKTVEQLTGTDDERKLLIWTATRGLVAFRQGNISRGRDLYRRSIVGWQKQENGQANAARAAIFWAREELRAKTDHGGLALQVADMLCTRTAGNDEVLVLRNRLPH
jgi:Flp pilus assembly protein TadD